MRRRRVPLGDLVFLALALTAAWPVFAARHLPIEDLPQHLAAVRVLADFGDPALGFARHFEVTLLKTQYLTYYLATVPLAKVVGVELAVKLTLALLLVGLPVSMRALLRALGKDPRLAIFTLPLAWNAHVLLGFFNFAAAMPLALLGLAAAVRLRVEGARRHAVALGALALLTFYSHVVPFAFLGVGAAVVLAGDSVRATARRFVALVPAGLATLGWLATSAAGRSVLAASRALGDGRAISPTYASWPESLREAPGWLTDLLTSDSDDKLLVAWGIAVLAALALGAGRGGRASGSVEGALGARLALLVPVAAVAYFVAPTGYDWIWPINARFVTLACVLLPLALPDLPRLTGHLVYVGVAALAIAGVRDLGGAFRSFERDEVGDLDRAIESIPPASKVVGLVFDRGSRFVRFSPFLHAVGWYQARRGGAVMFSFADFPQSPFKFRDDDRPPKVPPRWEWLPESVDPARDLAFFDYALVRGGPGRIGAEASGFERVFAGRSWTVFRRRASGTAR